MAAHIVCSIDGCGKKHAARGLCLPHYQKAWASGNMPPLVGREHLKSHRICGVEGCGKRVHAHGYCGKHAAKFKAYGDPTAGRDGPSPGEPLRWIQENTSYQGDDCLVWPYEKGRYGYGTVRHLGKKRVASRVMCEFAHGMPPDERMEAAHSCGNGHLACMNPRHLRWATKEENCADVKKHGRHVRANERRSSATARKSNALTVDDVRAIRALVKTMMAKDVAAMFGIGETTVSKIKTGKRWGCVE